MHYRCPFNGRGIDHHPDCDTRHPAYIADQVAGLRFSANPRGQGAMAKRNAQQAEARDKARKRKAAGFEPLPSDTPRPAVVVREYDPIRGQMVTHTRVVTPYSAAPKRAYNVKTGRDLPAPKRKAAVYRILD